MYNPHGGRTLGPDSMYRNHSHYYDDTIITKIIYIKFYSRILTNTGCGYMCVVTSPCPKPQVMVLYHPSKTYIRYITLPGSNYWHLITLYAHNSMLLRPNSNAYGVVAGMLWLCHDSSPKLWSCIIHERLICIWSIFNNWKIVVGLT